MRKELNTLYTPAQVAERVDMSQSSVRRYTIALEKAGYTHIKRDPNNHRKYDVYDIQTIEHFKNLINEKKLSFELALEKTMNDIQYIHSNIDAQQASAVTQSHTNTELEDKVDMLINLVQDLHTKTDRLEEENKQLNQKIGQLQNDDQETKQLQGTVQNEQERTDDESLQLTSNSDHMDKEEDIQSADEEGEEPPKKKGFFARLFNR